MSVDRREIMSFVTYALRTLRAHGKALFLEINLIPEATIKALFRKHLDEDRSSGVLTFDLSEKGRTQAVLFICPGYAKKIARSFKVSAREELLRYIAHGILSIRGVAKTLTARARRAKTYSLITGFFKRHETKPCGKR